MLAVDGTCLSAESPKISSVVDATDFSKPVAVAPLRSVGGDVVWFTGIALFELPLKVSTVEPDPSELKNLELLKADWLELPLLVVALDPKYGMDVLDEEYDAFVEGAS